MWGLAPIDELGVDDMFVRWPLPDNYMQGSDERLSSGTWDLEQISSPILPIAAKPETAQDLFFDLTPQPAGVFQELRLLPKKTQPRMRRSPVFQPFTSLEALEESVKGLNAFLGNTTLDPSGAWLPEWVLNAS